MAPLPILAALLAGFFLLSLTERFRRVGRWGVGVSLVLFWALGTTPVADALIRPFESRFAPVLDPAAVASELGESVRWVVVLGGGHRSDRRYPAAARLHGESLFRVTEGVRLHRARPESRLLFTGFGGPDPVPSAEAGRDAAVAMGVDPSWIAMDADPRDTHEEALAVARIFAEEGRLTQPFFLVTSSAHMPRSVVHFQGVGLNPIPAPAQAYALEGRRLQMRDLFPEARNFVKVRGRSPSGASPSPATVSQAPSGSPASRAATCWTHHPASHRSPSGRGSCSPRPMAFTSASVRVQSRRKRSSLSSSAAAARRRASSGVK